MNQKEKKELSDLKRFREVARRVTDLEKRIITIHNNYFNQVGSTSTYDNIVYSQQPDYFPRNKTGAREWLGFQKQVSLVFQEASRRKATLIQWIDKRIEMLEKAPDTVPTIPVKSPRKKKMRVTQLGFTF